MGRFKIVATAAVSGLLGMAVAAALTSYTSWSRVVSDEQSLLKIFSDRAMKNFENSLGQGRSAITSLAQWDGEFCSPEHVAFMRRITTNTRAIEDGSVYRRLLTRLVRHLLPVP